MNLGKSVKLFQITQALIFSFLCLLLVQQNPALVAVAWVLADPLLSNLHQILVTGYHPLVDLSRQSLFTRKIGIEPGECALSLITLVQRVIHDKQSIVALLSVLFATMQYSSWLIATSCCAVCYFLAKD